jgi:hypothetical protein
MANIKQSAKWVVGMASALLLSFASLVWYGLHVLKAHQVRETVTVVERFHQHFNAGEFDKICDEAIGCPEGVRKDWHSVLQDVADRAGKFREVKSAKIKAYIKPFEVHATYVCSFEKTDVEEAFVLTGSDDGHVRILSYGTVTNPALPADQHKFK